MRLSLSRCRPLAPALVVSVCLAFPLHADEPELAVKAGFVTSGLYAFGETVPDWVDVSSSARGSFCGGIGARFDLPGRFALQVDALFVRKSADITAEFEISFPCCEPREIRLRAEYLEVPIMGRYELSTGDTRTYLLAGPALAFKTGARVEGTFVDFLSIIDPEFHRSVRALDLSLGLGAGVELGDGLLLEARGNWGLRSVFDGGSHDPLLATRGEPRHRTGMLMVGYRF